MNVGLFYCEDTPKFLIIPLSSIGVVFQSRFLNRLKSILVKRITRLPVLIFPDLQLHGISFSGIVRNPIYQNSLSLKLAFHS